MIRIGRAAVLLCVCVAVFAGAQAKVETVTTPGEYQFLFSPVGKTNRVAFQVAWPSNWFKEDGRNPAVPYLGVEVMTSSGAGDMDASELLEAFSDLDATAHVWATADHVRAALDVRVVHLEEATEVARAVLARPRFDSRWLNRTRDGMYGRLKQEQAQIAIKGWEAVRRAVLGTQPINAALSMSDLEAFHRITRDDLLDWHARTFVTEGARIAVAGNISRHDAVAVVDRVFGALPAGRREPMVAIETDFSPRTILVHVPGAEKSMIGFVGRLPSLVHGGESEDLISVLALGTGPRSRIVDAIRTKLRASYAVGASLAEYTRDIRLVSLWGEIDADKLARSREAMLEAYRRFRDEGPTEKELAPIKAQLRHLTRENLKKPSTVVHVLLEATLEDDDPQRIDRLLHEIEATSPQSIRERLRHAFPAPEELIQVIVTSDEDAIEGACVVRTIADVDGCRATH